MSSKDVIRVGIVGARFAASFHFETLKRVYGVPIEIVGVTSKSREQREKFASERGIKAFDSVESLLDAVDVIDICAPAYVHEEITIKAARAGKHCIVEKPFTGSFLNQEDYDSQETKQETFNEQRYREAVESAERMVTAVREAGIILNFAENWHFLPAGLKAGRLLERAAYQKERQDNGWKLTKLDPGARILYIRGEESHSGSHSSVYGDLKYSGGGSIVGKACHPLGVALYLKRLEGVIRGEGPIVPVAVWGQVAWLTKGNYRNPIYENPWKLRADYKDGEDWGAVDILFSDDTRARVESSEVKLGGVYNWFEVFGNKFFIRGNINPNNSLQAYAPSPEVFQPEYLTEKVETHAGMSQPSLDEDWFHGYVHQMQVFFERIADPKREWRPPFLNPGHDCDLALDSVKVMYGAYLSAERGGAMVRLDDPFAR